MQQYFSVSAHKMHFFVFFFSKNLSVRKYLVPLHSHLSRKANAQMAESVDALVSNTSGAIHPGSIPGLGTQEGLTTLRLSTPLSLYDIPTICKRFHTFWLLTIRFFWKCQFFFIYLQTR